MWYINGTPLSDFQGKISGANTDSVTAQNVVPGDLGGSNFGNVYVSIMGSCPTQGVSSNSVSLTLNTSLSIVQQSPETVSACEASTVALFVRANTEATYQWKKNGTAMNTETNDTLLLDNLAATDAASYTCDISSGCGNTSSTASELTVDAAPAPIISVNGNVLSTQPFATYQWYKNNVAINNADQQNYTATSSGLYSVEVTSSAGCAARSDEHNFVLSGLTGISRNTFHLVAYPNPVHESLYLTFDLQLRVEQVEVIDVTGKIISTHLYEKDRPVNVSHLAAGMYVLSVKGNQGTQVQMRFVKE